MDYYVLSDTKILSFDTFTKKHMKTNPSLYIIFEIT